MLVLGGWGLANTAIGFGLSANAVGDAKYTFRMCGYFGLVNLALSQLGYWDARKKKDKKLSAVEDLRQQRKIEKVFLVNTGLDVLYMAGGLHLINRGLQKTGIDRDKPLGFGRGLMIQGGFLFLFDGIQYLTHRKNGKGLHSGLETGVTGTGLYLRLKL